MSKPDAHAHIKQKKLQALRKDVKGAVITVSDRCITGEREDKSGPLAVQLLAKHRVIVDAVEVVPDGVEPVRDAITRAIAAGARVIFTTGGTGVTETDLTPEATIPLLNARLTGIETQIMLHGLQQTPLASLSRAVVGVTARGVTGCLIINSPGSRGAVHDTIEVVGPLIPHILEQLDPETFPLPQ